MCYIEKQNKAMSGKPYILGLDLGTNSIGWAVVDCEIDAGYKPVSLRALNSRIFEDMLEAKTKVPKNQKRRAMRGARNRRAYYKQRRQGLVEILLKNNLLPEEYSQDREGTLNKIDLRYAKRKLDKPWCKEWKVTEKAYCSPYAMRNFALEEKLEPYELGRLLLHLQRRRGYFSNRGAKYIELIKWLKLEMPEDDDDASIDEEKKETKKTKNVLEGIAQLSEELGGRTLGQFIWKKSQEKDMPPQRVTLFEFEQSRRTKEGKEVIKRLRFFAQREMYEEEFDRIWEKQNGFHKLNDKLAQEIKHKIFHQRPLQLQKGTVGDCNIYPRKKRGAKMRLEFQEFRTLQVINNIKVAQKPLTEEQRNTLLEATNDPTKLNNKGRISKGEVCKILGVKSKEINHDWDDDDGEGKTSLPGNRTAQAISRSIGVNAWRKLDNDQQIKLVEDLLTIHNPKDLYKRLVNPKHWGFSRYQLGDDLTQGALGLAMNEQLEGGYGKHSLKAIKELLPHMRKGTDYKTAVEKIGKRENIIKEILDPEDIPNIANPIVQKALFEVRRVVNSIVERYGKPAIIRMEMARDMKSSKKHRRKITTQQKANREANEDAEKEILEWCKGGEVNVSLDAVRGGLRRVSLKDRQKYKMWKEQKEQCPYCQKEIGFKELFSGAAEEEHILPYTGFRQSYMNTVLSCQTCNATKEKKTPYEAWGSDKNRWEDIKKFIEETTTIPFPKRKNILNEEKDYSPENEDNFVKRQLNDTRYIATASKKVLEKYGVQVDVNNGGATHELRHELGLNNILPKEPDSGAYEIDKEAGEILLYKADKAVKSRQDHRHHAVDAFVVAITDRAMLQAMIKAHQAKQDGKTPSKKKPLRLPESWKDSDNLHSVLKKKLNATVVSHMIKRKVWGALHDETLYGKSHFEQSLNIESMRPNVLQEVQKIAEAEANGEEPWIADEELRAVLLQWAKETQNREPADRALPDWKGKKLREFVYKTPCVTIRKELNGELLSKIDEEWKPGKGTWIAEKSVHEVLYKWVKKHNLVGKTAKAINAKLKETPPRIINKQGKPRAVNKQGKPRPVIRRVRMAQALPGSYVKIANSHVRPGNNHHFVLFHNGKEGKDKERRFQVVTMLEAAKRASSGKPVVDKEPSPEWNGEWHYELHLCVNDMVRCEDLDIFDDENRFDPKHRDTPYFRVQTISSTGETPDLRLRHHSISGTDSNWGLWRIRSLNNIKCKRAQPSVLGLLPDDSQNDRDRL